MISSSTLRRPRTLLMLLGAVLLLAGMWFVMRAWHAESHEVELYVRGALADYGPLLLFLLSIDTGNRYSSPPSKPLTSSLYS